MAGKKRQCGSCRFFIESQHGSSGHCSNPNWEGSRPPVLIVRPSELACRSQWGRNLWEDPNDPIDVDPSRPQQPTLPEPITVPLLFDDEVTSVSIAGSKNTRVSNDDDVVDSGATHSIWDDSLQQERRALLRSSPHEAVAGARKRMLDRKERQRELIPFADDDSTTDDATSPDASANEDLPAATLTPTFPPDDFVEQELPTSSDEETLDDEIVDNGLPGNARSPRLRHLLRDDSSPKNHKAMKLGAPAEMVVTAHNPEHREQWNSVPQITPGFELPLQQASEAAESAPRLAASAATYAAPQTNRPVSQAREVVNESRLRDQRARRQIAAPMANDVEVEREVAAHPAAEQSSPTLSQVQRARLTQAPAPQAPMVDRLKASPLRGYHPVPKSTARTPQPDVDEKTLRTRVTEPMPIPAAPQAPSNRAAERAAADDLPEVTTLAAATQRRPFIPLNHVPATPFKSQAPTISPDIPRACGTCASYLPSNVQGRGSCTNAFAGPVQRVVYAESMACQHTFGCFWLPADDLVWLEELEDQSAPTPRIDRMVARRQTRRAPALPDLEELTS